MQLETKENKLIETLFIKGRHNKPGIVQCGESTQSTTHIEKANTDFFVSIPPFNDSTAQYYHEKFLPILTAKSISKLRLLAEKKAYKEDNPELNYLIITKLGDINMAYKYRVCPFKNGTYAMELIQILILTNVD